MKFDIVRAWKDESYRQGLSDEQLNTLPINPVGELELNDAELAAIYGGEVGPGFLGGLGIPDLGGTGVGVGTAHSASLASSERIHSFSFECDENIFSWNTIDLRSLRLANILSPTTQICANNN